MTTQPAKEPTTLATCDHPRESAIYTREELRQMWGPTALTRVPQHPGIIRLKNDSGEAVYLSRLDCGHFAMTSPTTMAEAKQKAGHLLDVPETKHGQYTDAAEHYENLLTRVRAGEYVDPAEVVLAKQAIELQKLADEGQHKRAEELRVKQAAAARNALEVPALEELQESRDRLQRLQKQAYETLLSLFDAVDEDAELQTEVGDRLIEAGFDQAEVHPPVRGFLRTTVVGDQEFPYWTKAEWLIGILNVVMHGKKHPNALNGNEGRDLRKVLPSTLQQGPRPEP